MDVIVLGGRDDQSGAHFTASGCTRLPSDAELVKAARAMIRRGGKPAANALVADARRRAARARGGGEPGDSGLVADARRRAQAARFQRGAAVAEPPSPGPAAPAVPPGAQADKASPKGQRALRDLVAWLLTARQKASLWQHGDDEASSPAALAGEFERRRKRAVRDGAPLRRVLDLQFYAPQSLIAADAEQRLLDSITKAET